MKKYIIILICLSMILSSLAGSGFAAEEEMRLSGEYEFLIYLKAARFDPLLSDPNIPSDLTYDMDTGYYLVQFSGPIREEWIFEITDSGGFVLGYIPQYTYIVHMEKDLKEKLQDHLYIRWIGLYHPAYKIEKNLHQRTQTLSLNVMVFELGLGNKNLNIVREQVEILGGRIIKEEPEAGNIVVEISGSKIPDIAFIPHVEWIDEYSEPVSLMDNIRVFTGATSPLHEFGFNGSGIVGEVKDSGLDEDHVEFEGQIIGTDPDNIDEDSHGTSTFGIVFAKGVSERAKGMLPEGDGVFCDWAVGRIQSVANLVNNWDGLFQSNSWHSGSADSSYQSNSRQNDEAVFEYDISMLYASGNGGSDGSITREATAKNVITVGGIDHQDNQDRSDDVHNGNQGNKGPVDDGRIKPDVVGPYESIYTTTSGGGYTSGFGGTSGATPVAAGGVGLIYEMYKRNHFGNNPSGTIPHSATVKAILIADAYQYELTQADRMAQGWGLVDVGNAYFIGENHLIDDESKSLRTGESEVYNIRPTGIHQLKITLVWTDVPGTTSSDLHLINNLNLKVTDPEGTVFWGNYGLDSSKWSSSGGSSDSLNNVENVFLENPISGEWTIEVIAENIALDGNTDSIQIDQNYALVASGVIGPDHDMVVSYMEELPRFFSLHKGSFVNGTISNIGAQDETNVVVNLLENNDIVDTKIIDFIASGTSTSVSLSWMPEVERTSDMTIEVVQISGETNLFNNKKTASVDIFAPLGFVLVDDFHGNDQNYDSFYEHLYSIKYPVTYAESETTSELLGRYNVFITAGATSSYSSEEITAITNFVENGGGLFVIGDNDDTIYNSITDYAGIRWETPRGVGGDIDNINPHNTTEGVSELYLDSPNLVLEVTAPALEIAYDSDVILNRPLIAASEHSKGRVVALSDDNCIDNVNLDTSDNRLFGENVILWLNTNLPPFAIIDFPLDASIHSSTSEIQFDGTSSYDPDGYIIDYLWSSDIEGMIGDQEIFTIQLHPGDHEIKLRITDNGGLISLTSIDITVSTPNPPSISIISPDEGSTHNKVITISGIASDIDGFVDSVEVKIGGGNWELTSGTDNWDYAWDTKTVPDGEWEIEARAYDGEGLVSEIVGISVNVDNTPPMVFNGPKVQNITQNSAKIVWSTNEPGDSLVDYGEDTNYGSSATSSGFVTDHEIILQNLNPDTEYHFRVITKDALGNTQDEIGDKKFSTEPEPDITGPEVSIYSPKDGEIISQGIEIEVEATDDSGVDYVEFYINNDLKFSDSNPAFSWFWNTNSGDYPDGQYRINVIAYDKVGNRAEFEITIEVDNEKILPSIKRVDASPNSIDSQDSSDVLFTVDINDPEKGVESVTIDLSSLGRSSKQRMYDDGTHGDEEAEDGIYSYEAMIPPNVDPGEKTVSITVTYDEGESIESEVSFLVESKNLDQEEESEDSGIPLMLLFLFIFVVIILVIALVATSSRRNRKAKQKEMVAVSVAQPVYFQPQQVYYQDQTVYNQQYYRK